MTYDAALNIALLIAIPAVVLVSYRLFTMYIKNRNRDAIDGNPLAYEIDPNSGEIRFGDEQPNSNTVSAEELQMVDLSAMELEIDEEISMVDVLAPDGDDLTILATAPNKEPEETEA